MAVIKKDINYFEMFAKGVTYSLDAAKKLRELMEDGQLSEEKVAAIKKIENDADNHMHMLSKELNIAFITPIDRDDIYKIAKETDDITDSIESCSNVMWVMQITKATPAMKQMADYAVKACEQLVELMNEIKNRKKANKLNEYTVEINRIEEMGDKCYKNAIRDLFEKEKDAIQLIKMKEMYMELEDTLDNCEDVADCVESIIITKT